MELWKEEIKTEFIGFFLFYLFLFFASCTGDHYRIFFSDKDKVNPDEDKDVIFYQLEIFYKQQGIDSLSIYVPSNVRKEEENTQIGKIKISINSIVVGTQLDNYRQNYKKLGLCRVSVYDGID